MILPEDPAFDSRMTIMRKAMAPKDMTGRVQTSVQQQSGRWAGQGAQD
jgi:hypothetical protein